MRKMDFSLMRFICVLYIALLGPSYLLAQPYFAGQINYQSHYKSLNPKIKVSDLEKRFGQKSTTIFREGSYHEKYDSGMMSEQYYDQKENKSYYRKEHSDTLFWFHCLQPAQPYLRYTITPHKDTILGIVCDELATFYTDKTIRFYYNPDTLRINPKWYADCTFANKNINTEHMKSLFLKYTLETANFTLSMAATHIEAKTISDADLFYPPNSKLQEEKP